MIHYRSEAGSAAVEIEVEGKVTDAELKAALARFRADVEAGKTRVIEIIRDFDGIEPKALWTDLTQAAPLASKVERAAVVADAGWIRSLASMSQHFIRAEVRSFEPDKIEVARAWIAGP